MKNKFKYKIIEEYIKILQIHNNCNNNIDKLCDKSFDCLLDKTTHLVNIYEKLIFKFGLMDLSFLILKKDILFSNSHCVDFEVESYKDVVDNFLKNIAHTLKRLKLNEFEVSYLLNSR